MKHRPGTAALRRYGLKRGMVQLEHKCFFCDHKFEMIAETPGVVQCPSCGTSYTFKPLSTF